jgi:hypothetical protein
MRETSRLADDVYPTKGPASSREQYRSERGNIERRAPVPREAGTFGPHLSANDSGPGIPAAQTFDQRIEV